MQHVFSGVFTRVGTVDRLLSASSRHKRKAAQQPPQRTRNHFVELAKTRGQNAALQARCKILFKAVGDADMPGTLELSLFRREARNASATSWGACSRSRPAWIRSTNMPATLRATASNSGPGRSICACKASKREIRRESP